MGSSFGKFFVKLVLIVFSFSILLPVTSFAVEPGTPGRGLSDWELFNMKAWSQFQLNNPNKITYVDTTKFKKDPPYTIAYANCSISNIWAIFVAQEFKAQAERWKQKGIVKEWFHTDAQDKPDKQIADIQDLVVKGVDLIIARPATEAGLDPIISKLHKKGIPIVCVSRRIKSDNFVTHVVCSNFASARTMMTWLCQMLNGKGNIVCTWGKPGSSTVAERKAGAYEALKRFPGIKVLEEQYTSWSPAIGKKVMKAMIARHGDKIQGVFNDYGLQMGVLEALAEADLIVPVTGDTINGFMKRVQKYGFPACVVSGAIMLGSLSVNVALDVLQGRPVPFPYEMPGIIITTNDTLDVKTQMPWNQFTRLDKPDDWYEDNTFQFDEIGKKFSP